MRRVIVDVIELYPYETIATGAGYDVETHERVTFGGDWRPMRGIAEAIDQGEAPEAHVPDWAVLTVTKS